MAHKHLGGGHFENADPPPAAVVEAERATRALAVDLAGVDRSRATTAGWYWS